MKISELCKHSGLSKDGIRHYEALGLLRSNNVPLGSKFYRDYSEDSLKRLELIQCGKKIGFTLDEMKPFIQNFDDSPLNNDEVRQALKEKLQELDHKMENIQKMRNLINEFLK